MEKRFNKKFSKNNDKLHFSNLLLVLGNRVESFSLGFTIYTLLSFFGFEQLISDKKCTQLRQLRLSLTKKKKKLVRKSCSPVADCHCSAEASNAGVGRGIEQNRYMFIFFFRKKNLYGDSWRAKICILLKNVFAASGWAIADQVTFLQQEVSCYFKAYPFQLSFNL